MWDNTSGAEVLSLLTGHTNEVLSVAISCDGVHIASGSADGTVCLWNVASGLECFQPLQVHGGDSWVEFVVFSPDRSPMAPGSDCTTHVWDVILGKEEISQCKGHTGSIN